MAKTVAVRKPRNKIVEQIKELTIKDLASGAGVGKLYQVVAGQGVIANSKYGTIPPPPDVFYLSQSAEYHPFDIVNMALVHTGGSISGTYFDSRYKVVEVPKTSELFKKFMEDTKATRLTSALASSKHHSYIGSDPEIFAARPDGTLVPAFEFLRSKKENGRIYWDGYQAEFAPHTDTCLNGHISGNIVRCLRELRSALKAKFPKASLVLKNTFDIPEERLANDDPEFVAFGCTPSLNAYGEEPAVKMLGKDVPFRTAGGHMHFTCLQKNAPAYVKELDRVLGVISVAMFQYWDSPRRRMFYGRAGEYRLPSYGMEYRVLSNAWLAHPALAHFVYEVARVVIGQVAGKTEQNKTLRRFEEWDVTEEEARTCINECNVELAVKLLERNSETLTALLKALPGIGPFTPNYAKLPEIWKTMVMEGAHKFLKDPDKVSIGWDSGTNMQSSISRIMLGSLD